MQRSEQGVSHRAGLGTVPAMPFPTKVNPVADVCLAWLRADVRLDTLTSEWSQAEADVMKAQVQPSQAEAAVRIGRLERQIARIDRTRSGLLNRIAETPATSPGEAVSKLLVLERLLEGEGGIEHDIVADAVMLLAADLGSDHRCRR